MEKKELKINYTSYKSIDELPHDERLLLNKAIEATSGSYSPYSGFSVGAAVRMANKGEVGCKTVFDVPPALLSMKSPEELRAQLL